MYACPHCGKSGISFIRKMFLGPAIPATCNVCGKKIGVPWLRSLLAVVPIFVICNFLTSIYQDTAIKIIVWSLGGVVVLTLYSKWVPLEKR